MIRCINSAYCRCARCNLWPQLSTFLGHWALDSRALHFTFVVHNHASVVLKIHEHTLPATPWLALPDHHALQYFLPQLRFSFLASAEDHVARGTVWKFIQTATDATHGHDVQVLRSRVVRTIHCCCHLTTEGHLQLGCPSSLSALHRCLRVLRSKKMPLQRMKLPSHSCLE